MQKPWTGRIFFTGSAMKMPMASLHIGQRRMSRFAADGWEPNLRITPRTKVGLPSHVPYIFHNKLHTPKKDG
jgi:hypothetical protein